MCEATREERKKSDNLEEIEVAPLKPEVKTIEESLQNDPMGTSNGSSYKIKQLFNRHGYNLNILVGHVKGE